MNVKDFPILDLDEVPPVRIHSSEEAVLFLSNLPDDISEASLASIIQRRNDYIQAGVKAGLATTAAIISYWAENIYAIEETISGRYDNETRPKH